MVRVRVRVRVRVSPSPHPNPNPNPDLLRVRLEERHLLHALDGVQVDPLGLALLRLTW